MSIDSPDRKLKIASLIFGSLTRIGGYQVFTYNLLRELAMRGHQVDLYVPREEYTQNRAFYDSLPFTVKPLFWKTFTMAKRFPWVLQIFLRFVNAVQHYDVWQIVGSYPAGFLASYLFGKVPLVLRTHGDDIQKDEALDYGLRLDPELERRIRFTCHRMDRVIAITKSITECYRDLDVSEDSIVEIPNGVDIDHLQSPHDNAATREELNIPTDRPLLLTVGRYHPKKGFSHIPAIARLLKEKGISFNWIVVGGQTRELGPLIKEAGVADVVRTIDEIGVSTANGSGARITLPDERLVRIYQCADVFVYPSLLESFGRVLIEAMAAGLPVVTTNAPGCRDVVQHDVTGLLSDPYDTEGMASNVELVINDAELAKRLSSEGLAYSRKYDWSNVIEAYETLYKCLLRSTKMGV